MHPYRKYALLRQKS